MSMYHRFFTVDETTPLFKEIKKLVEQRRKAHGVLNQFLKDHGIDTLYGNSPATYVVDFKSSKDVDLQTWAKTKPRRGEYFFRPRKNTPEGKALLAKMKELPTYPDLNDALRTVPNLHHGFPCFVDGNTWYKPHLRFFSLRKGIAILSVPWRDEDQKMLAEYKAQRDGDAERSEWSAYKDYMLWTPPEWLTEVKEWEALKIIDEEG